MIKSASVVGLPVAPLRRPAPRKFGAAALRLASATVHVTVTLAWPVISRAEVIRPLASRSTAKIRKRAA